MVTRHIEENMANVKEQNKSPETVSEETHASGLLDKDFKTMS